MYQISLWGKSYIFIYKVIVSAQIKVKLVHTVRIISVFKGVAIQSFPE